MLSRLDRIIEEVLYASTVVRKDAKETEKNKTFCLIFLLMAFQLGGARAPYPPWLRL